MDDYEVIMTSDAITDIFDIRNYIADVLLVPDIAFTSISEQMKIRREFIY